MNHVAKLTSAGLSIFDEELRAAVAPIAEFAGLEALPLVLDNPALSRAKVSVDVDFLFTTSIYTRRVGGHSHNLEDVPSMDDPSVYVKQQADARFRDAISGEALRENLRGQVAGKGSVLVCDDAYALSSQNCGCGNGKVGCRGCSGSGTTVCRNCQLTSDFRGRVKCWHCHGEKGQRDDRGEWHNCHTCAGHGRVPCGYCGGTQKSRCQGCGGHGTHTCGSCNGHAFVTDIYCFKIEMDADVGAIRSDAPGHLVDDLREWVYGGLRSHASERENPIYPWSDFATAQPSYFGWKDGVYRATLPLSCEITHAELDAEYRGSPTAVTYVRIHEPKFRFPNFLDMELSALSAKTEDLSKRRPAEFLSEIQNVKGLAFAMGNLIATTDSWREKWVEDNAERLKGAVSRTVLDKIARHYLLSLKAYEKKMVAGAFVSIAPVVACVGFAAWYFGIFDIAVDVARGAPLAVFVLGGLAFSMLTAFAVVGNARKRVSKETGNPCFLALGWGGKAACIALGFLIVHMGMTAAAQQW